MVVLKRNEAREDGQEDRGEQNERDVWWRDALTSCSDTFLLSCSVVSLSSVVPRRDSLLSASQKTAKELKLPSFFKNSF